MWQTTLGLRIWLSLAWSCIESITYSNRPPTWLAIPGVPLEHDHNSNSRQPTSNSLMISRWFPISITAWNTPPKAGHTYQWGHIHRKHASSWVDIISFPATEHLSIAAAAAAVVVGRDPVAVCFRHWPSKNAPRKKRRQSIQLPRLENHGGGSKLPILPELAVRPLSAPAQAGTGPLSSVQCYSVDVVEMKSWHFFLLSLAHPRERNFPFGFYPQNRPPPRRIRFALVWPLTPECFPLFTAFPNRKITLIFLKFGFVLAILGDCVFFVVKNWMQNMTVLSQKRSGLFWFSTIPRACD